MTRLIVKTPEPGYSGPVGAVLFHQGRAEVDPDLHAAELAYMRNAGYRIEDPETADEPAEAVAESPEPGAGEPVAKPKKTASVGEWRAYATSQGLTDEEADALTKNQLVERFADEEETAA